MNSIEQELKTFILSNYKSIREFALEIDMPYSTLDSIFKRGISNASITNIIKICNKLDISVDLLANGKIGKFDNSKTESPEYIKKYRSLNENGKRKVDDYMNFVLSQPENLMFKPDFKSIKNHAEELSDELIPLNQKKNTTSSK